MSVDTFQDFIDALEGATNVKSIKYDSITGLWIIEYKSWLKPDTVATEDLIDFLENA